MTDLARNCRSIAPLLALLAAPAVASADQVIASDSYQVGTNPAIGQYTAGNGLNNQSTGLTNTGFVAGGYTNGLGTANFVSSAAGLVNAADGATAASGSVGWIGAQGTTVKSVARNLASFNEGTSGTYWTSQLVRGDGTQTTTNGFVLAGFGNSVSPTAGTTSGFLTGIYLGFADVKGATNEADLVLRYRDTSGNNGGKSTADQVLVNGANNATANQTYLIVAEINVNSNGAHDQVSYWVNPTDLSSAAALSATAAASGTLDTYAYQGAATGTGDFTRLNYASLNWDGNATFDEARLGTSLASIAPAAVPEPGSIALLGVGLLGLIAIRRRPG